MVAEVERAIGTGSMGSAFEPLPRRTANVTLLVAPSLDPSNPTIATPDPPLRTTPLSQLSGRQSSSQTPVPVGATPGAGEGEGAVGGASAGYESSPVLCPSSVRPRHSMHVAAVEHQQLSGAPQLGNAGSAFEALPKR